MRRRLQVPPGKARHLGRGQLSGLEPEARHEAGSLAEERTHHRRLQRDASGRGAPDHGRRRRASSRALEAAGLERHSVRCDVQVESEQGHEAATITLVNQTVERRNFDANIYEVRVLAQVGEIEPFALEALPDSFRYDRRVAAYGINCGVGYAGGELQTLDTVAAGPASPDVLGRGSRAGARPAFRDARRVSTRAPRPTGRRVRIVARAALGRSRPWPSARDARIGVTACSISHVERLSGSLSKRGVAAPGSPLSTIRTCSAPSSSPTRPSFIRADPSTTRGARSRSASC